MIIDTGIRIEIWNEDETDSDKTHRFVCWFDKQSCLGFINQLDDILNKGI